MRPIQKQADAFHKIAMPMYYHVTPWENADAIMQNGLDYAKGDHQWGETPGNYFWQNRHDAQEYADDMGQMRYDDGGYDDPDDASYRVMPFKYTGPVMDDPEGNHELARGKSYYTTDPIPSTAFLDSHDRQSKKHYKQAEDHSPYADFIQWVVDDQNRVPDQDALEAYAQQSNLNAEDYQNISQFLDRTS